MKGTRPGKMPRPSRTSTEGRTCDIQGCQTKLSIYNSKGRCWQHTDLVFPNYRGRRLAPEGRA